MLQLFGVSAVSHMSTNVLIGTVCIISSVALLLLSEMVWYQHAWVSVRRRQKIEVDQSKRNVFNTGDANAVDQQNLFVDEGVVGQTHVPHVVEASTCDMRPTRYRPRSHQLPMVQFPHLPKVGSTTLRTWVRRQGGKDYSVWNDSLPVVAFLRDPLERFVSAFKEVFFARRALDGRYPSNFSVQRKFDSFTSDFINNDSFSSAYVAEHFRSQTQCVCVAGVCPRFAHLGEVRRLAEDWNEILVPLFNISPVSSKNMRPGRQVRLTLSDADARILCRIYYHDYCCFGLAVPERCAMRCDGGSWQPTKHKFVS